MIKPFCSAYKGEEKYIFISYAHKDAGNVFPAIAALQSKGYRIWYDEGIEFGDDWSGSIAKHLEKAAAVIFFMSKNTGSNQNIKRELLFAEENKIPVLTVLLGKFKISAEQEKQITVNQYIQLASYKTYAEFAEAAGPVLGKYDVLGQSCGAAPVINDRIRFKSENNKKLIKTVAIILIASIIAFAGFKLLFGTVPSVIGMNTDDAVNAVASAGFNSAVSLNYSDKYEYGTVFGQSADGTTLKMVPVVITQSLGPEENLTDVPLVVGSEISEGAGLLVAAGLKKFSVVPEFESDYKTCFISAQSIPAGLRVSRNNVMSLDVKTDGGEYSFTVDGREYTISGDSELVIDLSKEPEQEALSLDDQDKFEMTDAEWQLFYDNNRHSVWDAEQYASVWMPAALNSTIADNPDSCYGWVIVRDMDIDANSLFEGYSEIYVCPGITVTIKGDVTDRDLFQDIYVAPGGRLIFEDEVNGGVYLVNDGTTEFRKNLNGGQDGVLVANRGDITVAGTIGKGVNVWSFFESSLTGKDETGGTIHDYSPYRQINAANWYEGCSGSDGFWMIRDKLETFTHYSYKSDRKGQYGITPVIKPEDFEDHWEEEWYTNMYLFLDDYTITNCGVHRGATWMFIAAPGVTLTIDDEGGNYGTSVTADKGSTVIINGDIKGYWPYSPNFFNDGTIILNGNFTPVNEGSSCLLMNRGTFIANGEVGGPGMYCFNFAGASLTGNMKENTYIQNLDFIPDYIPYSNNYGGALWYNEEVLVKQYGYKNWQNANE